MIRFTDRELELADLQRKEEIEEPRREVDRTVRDIDGAVLSARPARHRPGLVALTANGLVSHIDRASTMALVEELERALCTNAAEEA